MKKVGIVTFHNTDNYGAELQAYALQETVKSLGDKYDVKIIDYRNSILEKNYKLFSIKGENIRLKIRSLIGNIIYLKKNICRRKSFRMYRKSNFYLTSKYKSDKKIKNEYPKFDIYITGSDQVWNHNIVGELSDIYTLNFGDKNIRRISYAASIGLNSISEEYKEIYFKKLQCLDSISVREKKAKDILNQIVNKNIEVVLDPTLLLTKIEWNKKIENLEKKNKKEKYILAYVVAPDKEYTKIVNQLSKKTGLKIIHFGKKDIYKGIQESAYTEGPLEFINYIRNAEYVVATSFHATVFSIIFNKNFFIVPHKNTSSRVTNLLERLNLSDRIFYSNEEFEKFNINAEIDWNSVEKMLSIERTNSIDWLKNALEG